MAKTYFLLLGLSLSFVIGCKKERRTEEAAPAPAAEAPAPEKPAAKRSETPAQSGEKLPGASVVRDDLKNKNYSKAVEALLVLRGYANANPEHWAEFRQLNADVARTLAAAAPTDPNAAKVLSAYNAAMAGR